MKNIYFMYHNQKDEIVVLFEKQEYAIENLKVGKNSTLVVVDTLLFKSGKEFYLTNNFIYVIFLPSLLRYYGKIHPSKNIQFIIEKNEGNLIIRANPNHYCLYHNLSPEQMDSLEDLAVPFEILYVKNSSILYDRMLYVVEKLRVYYGITIKLNVILISILLYLYT